MNVVGALFGIFRGAGLTSSIREGRPVAGFVLVGIVVMALSGGVYGLAMGIGIDVETALKNALKLALVFVFTVGFSLPVFFLAYRILGREERLGHIASVVVAGGLTSALLLAVIAPVVFLYGLASGFAPELLYVHVALVDVAALLGVFVMGNLVYRAFLPDRQRLVLPNAVGGLTMVLVAVVAVNFFGPFLTPSDTFSGGTDRLLDSVGIGVGEKVDRALRAATLSDRIEYRFRLIRPEDGTDKDFTVLRAGDNYQVAVRRLVRLGQPPLADRRVWLVEGKAFSDFGGQAVEVPRDELGDVLDEALPSAAFKTPDLEGLTYRARVEDIDGRQYYVARSNTRQNQVTVLLDPKSRVLHRLEITDPAAPGLTGLRISDIRSGTLTSATLQASLARAMEDIKNPADPRFREAWESQVIIASLERPDPTSFDYVNPSEFFALRYPRTWQQLPWNPVTRSVQFQECPASSCARLQVEIAELPRDRRLDSQLIAIKNQLEAQPQNRGVSVRIETLRGAQVGVVEYSSDYFEAGQLRTSHQADYWFLGRVARYLLTGSTAADEFEKYEAVFASAARSFEYLR